MTHKFGTCGQCGGLGFDLVDCGVCQTPSLRKIIFTTLNSAVEIGYEVDGDALPNWPPMDIIADLQAFSDDVIIQSCHVGQLLPHVEAWLLTTRESADRSVPCL